MRIVVAPDKLKGSLGAIGAAEAIARGAARAAPGASIVSKPVADGGEGTVEALVAATNGAYRTARVTGPFADDPKVEARYGMLGDGRTAVLEMAAASGLALLDPKRRDPLRTTTFGTGELIRAALDAGAERLVVGIGGSATNDGGAGMAQALGFALLDAEGRPIPPGGAGLERLDRIEVGGRDPRLGATPIRVACDVDNPLCGPRGASAVYGPQKGADPETVNRLDAALERFARIVERDLGVAVKDVPGAGAAGGLGAGLLAFAKGEMVSGIAMVLDAIGLADELRGADLCLTAEGRIDGSSAEGKAVVGVARAARAAGCPTFALAGSIGAGAERTRAEGVDAIFGICPGPVSEAEAFARASEFLERTAEEAVRAWLAGRGRGGR